MASKIAMLNKRVSSHTDFMCSPKESFSTSGDFLQHFNGKSLYTVFFYRSMVGFTLNLRVARSEALNLIWLP